MKGYIEFISKQDPPIGLITTCFGRIVYINKSWPHGPYEKLHGVRLNKHQKRDYIKNREFSKDELFLELI